MTVEKYYDQRAEEYNQDRRKGILGKVVRKESREIIRSLDPKPEEKILDAGCGSGFYSTIIKKMGAKPYGIDISQKMIEKLKERGIEGSKEDLENFNLQEKFDKVLCTGVLEFINNDYNAINSIKKHLKEEGKLIVLYPRLSLGGKLYWLYHLKNKINIRIYSKKRIKRLFEKNGLKIDYIKKVDFITGIICASLKNN